MKTINKFAALAGLIIALLFNSNANACNNSSLSLNSVSNSGGVWYVSVTLCIGAGRSGAAFGADAPTGTTFGFAMFGPATLRNKVLSWNASVTSDYTGATYLGDTVGPGFGLGEATNLLYSHPEGNAFYTCISSTAECGSIHSDCKIYNFSFQGILPDSIRALGIEGLAPFGGCYPNADMVVRFVCPTANAGSDQTLNPGGCATLNASVTHGVPPYTFSWSNGATTASTSVCPSTATTYSVTVTDSRLCSSVDQVNVSINTCGAFIANAGTDRTVFYGYLPQSCTSLSATASGSPSPYTYLWSNGATTSTLNVCPTSTTNYTVTITSIAGCIANDVVTVFVDDVRCGSNMTKVVVCRNGIQKCINQNQVGSHIASGWNLGACSNKSGAFVEEAMESFLEVMPNPMTDAGNIEFMNAGEGKVVVRLFDIQGTLIATLYEGTPSMGQEMSIEFNSTAYANGVYLLTMQTEDGMRLSKKMILAK
jgi:Secretion system C-terminal sorting domain